MSGFYKGRIKKNSLHLFQKNIPSYQNQQGALVPKKTSCMLCCLSRGISSQQAAGRDSSPELKSCQEYHVRLWAPQYKENIDLMEQDELRDCSVWCMRRGWENWVYSEKANGRPYCCWHLPNGTVLMGINRSGLFSRCLVSGWEAMDTSCNVGHRKGPERLWILLHTIIE